MTLRYLHLAIRHTRFFSHNLLNSLCPSSPLQAIVWVFSMAPWKALRKLVGLVPSALWALKYTWICFLWLWRCGSETTTLWALDWGWSRVTHWACTWMGPSECGDNLWFEYNNICVCPKCLLLPKDMDNVNSIHNKVIGSKIHYKFVHVGGLEVWLWEAQNLVKEPSEQLMSGVVIHIMHKNVLRSEGFDSISGGGQAGECPTR